MLIERAIDKAEEIGMRGAIVVGALGIGGPAPHLSETIAITALAASRA